MNAGEPVEEHFDLKSRAGTVLQFRSNISMIFLKEEASYIFHVS